MRKFLLVFLGAALCSGLGMAQSVLRTEDVLSSPKTKILSATTLSPAKRGEHLGARTLTYCAGAYDYWTGYSNQRVYPDSCGAAVGFTKANLADYVGGKVTKIRYALVNTDSISHMYIWLKLDTVVTKATTAFIAEVKDFKRGWNEVTLSEPIEITGKTPLFLGASFATCGISEPFTTNTSVTEVTYGLYFNHDTRWFNYNKTGNGNLAIEATVEGLKVLDYDANLQRIYTGGKNFKIGQPVTVSSVIYNSGAQTITNLNMTYKLGGKVVSSSTLAVNIEPEHLDTLSMTFTPDLSAVTLDQALTVSVDKVNGNADEYADDNTKSTTLSFFTQLFDRKVVVEEGTGTWCGWCPQGIVALRNMKAAHPDDFIGIAVHDDDDMTVAEYDKGVAFVNYPACNVDRTLMSVSVHPSVIESYYNTDKARQAVGKVDLLAELSADGNTIKTTASTSYSYTGAGTYNCALVLLEDSVTGYKQTNYYTQNMNGEMGGFESLYKSADIAFNDVARGIYPSYSGTLVADGVVSSKTYTLTKNISVPSTVQRTSKLSMVALLLDAVTGEIVNAQKVAVTDPTGTGAATAVVMADVKSQDPCYVSGKPITTTYVVYNKGKNLITSVDLAYSINGQQVYTETKSVKIAGGVKDTLTTTFTPSSSSLCNNVPLSITIVKMNGEANKDAANAIKSTNISIVEKMFDRTVVIEEGTGQWCLWCVRGIVAMDYMNKNYPSDFIGIAVHNNDKMAVSEYTNAQALGGYPGCNVDRTMLNQNVTTEGFVSFYKTEKARMAGGKIDVAGVFNADSTSIDLRAVSTFCYDSSDKFNCAFVLLEDSITGYKQKNAYAGGSYGEMGGFENLESPCSVTYYDVARAIYPSYTGTLMTNSVKSGEQYSYTGSLTLPTVQRKNKLTLVALLIDGTTGEIVNAQKARISDITGIGTTEIGEGIVDTQYFSLTGARIASPAKGGIYLKKVTYRNGKTVASKILKK
jgi:hypothetical protein